MTLDETWALCLEMWKWIMENHKEFGDVMILKEKWFADNEDAIEVGAIEADCFFCEYNVSQRGSDEGCECCPGKLIDDYFSCSDPNYSYFKKPKEFYAHILELHAIYLKGKQ